MKNGPHSFSDYTHPHTKFNQGSSISNTD